jgi:phosphopantothenoylcysteine decarboxylase/phosphopantothenate--cysteine ligase
MVIRTIGKRDLAGKKTLIIAGSTEEQVDDIRVLTNKSTGRTGVALAQNAYERGADVELWMGRCQIELPEFISARRFSSTNQLLEMVEDIDHDIVIIPAAISDYTVDKQKGKIPSGSEGLTIDLVPNPKIINEIKEKNNCLLVGFKAEIDIPKEELLNRAKKRMQDIGLDLIVANDVSKTTADENCVYIIGTDAKNEEVSAGKAEIAERILDRIVSLC